MFSLTSQTTTESPLPKAARYSRGHSPGRGAGVSLPGGSDCETAALPLVAFFWPSVTTFDRDSRGFRSARMNRTFQNLDQNSEARLP
jgi:hypothetical protein